MKNIILLLAITLMSVMVLVSMTTPKLQNDDWEVPSKYLKMENPYVDADDEDQEGRALYVKHCKSCHGTKGKGDGSKAPEIATKVTDLTTEEFKNQSDGAIFYKTFIGREDMPSFIKKIDDEEYQWLLVNYIKAF